MHQNLPEVDEAITNIIWPEQRKKSIRKVVINPVSPPAIFTPKKNKPLQYSTSYDKYLFSPNTFTYTTHLPPGVMVQRASRHLLGEGVLGRTFKGSNLVEIREDLYGEEFEEVLRHEVNHVMYPFLGEHEIRTKTKYELPFSPNFH